MNRSPHLTLRARSTWRAGVRRCAAAPGTSGMRCLAAHSKGHIQIGLLDASVVRPSATAVRPAWRGQPGAVSLTEEVCGMCVPGPGSGGGKNRRLMGVVPPCDVRRVVTGLTASADLLHTPIHRSAPPRPAPPSRLQTSRLYAHTLRPLYTQRHMHPHAHGPVHIHTRTGAHCSGKQVRS